MWQGDVITRYDVMLLGQWVHCSDRKACDKVTSYCTDVMLQVAVAPTGAMGAPGNADIAVTEKCATR